MSDPAVPEQSKVHAPHATLTNYYEGAKDRHAFVRRLFDETAEDYDRIERMMALGSGPWYRRRALVRSGLAPGMDVLDVAVGTGLVAREAAGIVGSTRKVIGVDPSIGMLRSAKRQLDIVAVQGMAENLPFVSDQFDFVTLGFALRHMSDLSIVFSDFHRVLRPGGTVCILEITRPEGSIARGVLKAYMRGLIPFLARVAGSRRNTAQLFEYFWDTIEACVRPERVVEALGQAGFVSVKRFVEVGVFSEYTGRKPNGRLEKRR